MVSEVDVEPNSNMINVSPLEVKCEAVVLQRGPNLELHGVLDSQTEKSNQIWLGYCPTSGTKDALIPAR